jgi:hypothetical protein
VPALGLARAQLCQAVGDRLDRRIAELLARLVDPDRALLRGEPVGKARQRRAARERREPPGGLARARERRCGPRRNAARRGLDPLRREQVAYELAEDHRLAIGDEVDVARTAARRTQHESLDSVLDVRRGGAVVAAADPGEAPAANHLDHHRHQGRVAAAPHEARAHDDRLKAVAPRGKHGLLRTRLAGTVERRRVGAQRRGLVDVDQRLTGQQHGLGTDVYEPTDARVGACLQRVSRTVDVAALEVLALAPVAERRRSVKRELAARGAGTHRRDVRELPLHRLGAARGDTLGGRGRAGEGAHAVAVGAQPLDQPTADETRAAGDERAGHLVEASRASPTRVARCRASPAGLRASHRRSSAAGLRFGRICSRHD